MRPRLPTPAETNRLGGTPVVIGGPEEGDDVVPCPALFDRDAGQVHVAYMLTPAERLALAEGGTVWLTTEGMLPVHRTFVTTSAGVEVVL